MNALQLNKSQERIARQIIETGLQREYEITECQNSTIIIPLFSVTCKKLIKIFI